MIANVNEQVWIDFDLETAVFLDTIAYWLKKNAANEQPKNFKDGRYWTYNTQAAYQKMFPGWSRETIRRIIRNCQKNGLILIDNFNKKRFDKTCWYSLTDKALEYYPTLWLIIKNAPNVDGASLVDSNQALVDSNQPIPKELPSVSNITISDNSQKSKKEDELIEQIQNVYHEELPHLPKIRRIDRLYRRQLVQMIDNWSYYQSEGKTFTIESFRNYLQVLKSSYKWLLEPYLTERGNPVKCTLRKLTRENTLTKIVNGEFSAD